MAQDKKENLHAGHRQKLKNRFLSEGAKGFEDHQLLEMILFYAIPRIDTNPVAHRLINKFGSLSGVFNATIPELEEVEGIGENAAILIKTYQEASKKYFCESLPKEGEVPTYNELGYKFTVLFSGLHYEAIYAVFFNNSMKICAEELVHTGDINAVGFSMRRLADIALSCNASFAVIAHNHPMGLPVASSNDLHTTGNISHFLAQMNVTLLDHFIVAEKRFSSITPKKYEETVRQYINSSRKEE